MPVIQKPVIHGRDHEHGSADPMLIHYEDVGAAGGGAATLAYASGTSSSLDVTTGFSGYFSFTNVHSSGVAISGTGIAIVTAGIYEVLAAGLAEVEGPATMPAGVAHLQVLLEINGGLGIIPAFAQALSPADIPSGHSWGNSLTLLEQAAFNGGDVLKLQAVNAASVTAAFDNWRVVVRQMA